MQYFMYGKIELSDNSNIDFGKKLQQLYKNLFHFFRQIKVEIS